MTANTQPIFPVAPKFASASIVPADAQALKTIYTAGTNGGRVSKFTLVSTDTANRDIGIYVTNVLIGTVAVPIGSGTSGVLPAVDVLANSNFKHSYYDANGNLVLDLPAGATLQINAPVTITAAKTVVGNCTAGDF